MWDRTPGSGRQGQDTQDTIAETGRMDESALQITLDMTAGLYLKTVNILANTFGKSVFSQKSELSRKLKFVLKQNFSLLSFHKKRESQYFSKNC
jgi:hypothetical protein